MQLPDNFAEEYHKNGAAVVPNFLTPEECDALKADMGQLIETLDFNQQLLAFDGDHEDSDKYFLDSSDNVSFFLEKGALKDGHLTVDKHLAINKIGHGLHAARPAFRKVTFHRNAKEILRRLDMKDPVVAQTMYIFKQPRIGDPVSIHQDTSFIYADPPERLLGIWVALDDATCENGCLWYLPGSHKAGLRGNARLVRKVDPETGKILDELEKIGEWPTAVYEGEQWVPLEVKKGTAVIIHGTVVHKSEPNTSDKQRPIYTWHLYDKANAMWYNRNWLQPKRGPFWSAYDTDPDGSDLPDGWKAN